MGWFSSSSSNNSSPSSSSLNATSSPSPNVTTNPANLPVTSPSDPTTQPSRIPPSSTPLSPAQTTTLVPSPLDATASAAERNRRIVTHLCIGTMILAPAVALLPPRKLDPFTFGLGICWCVSAGWVLEESTGKGLVWHVANQVPSRTNRRRWKEDKDGSIEGEDRVEDEGQRGLREAKEAGKDRSMLKKIWLGGESENWIEERARREREALDEGRGYASLIMEHLREAWPWGDKTEAREEEGED